MEFDLRNLRQQRQRQHFENKLGSRGFVGKKTFFLYLFNVGPEVVHFTCDGACYASHPQLLLHLLPLLGLPHLDVITGTSAHQLGKKHTHTSMRNSDRSVELICYLYLSLTLCQSNVF